jgi:hypothetical protein
MGQCDEKDREQRSGVVVCKVLGGQIGNDALAPALAPEIMIV